MKLRFNVGAIVEITLYGVSEATTVTGRVVKVLEDEVQLCPQRRIIQAKSELEEVLDRQYMPLCSADVVGEIVHVNRQLIRSWKYVKSEEIKDSIRQNPSLKLNYYDKDNGGYCEGSGEYCGNICEKYAMPVIIAINKTEKE